MTKNKYTFGDNERASARLRRLAEIYEPETRELLCRSPVKEPRLAVDLGCGPGWSTRLLQETLRPLRTVGLDSSERYVVEARTNHGPGLDFEVHDITRAPFPVREPDLLLCRFLLTHLRQPEEVLATWASLAASGAYLLVHETELLTSVHPALKRYYELVAELQEHYGQMLNIGERLEACFAQTDWRLVESRAPVLEKSSASMSELHLANLRTWRSDEYASRRFDPVEIDRLETSLTRIAAGVENGGTVLNTARQIVARLS
jgi:trans-aconitate 2-methyltransferase